MAFNSPENQSPETCDTSKRNFLAVSVIVATGLLFGGCKEEIFQVTDLAADGEARTGEKFIYYDERNPCVIGGKEYKSILIKGKSGRLSPAYINSETQEILTTADGLIVPFVYEQIKNVKGRQYIYISFKNDKRPYSDGYIDLETRELLRTSTGEIIKSFFNTECVLGGKKCDIVKIDLPRKKYHEIIEKYPYLDLETTSILKTPDGVIIMGAIGNKETFKIGNNNYLGVILLPDNEESLYCFIDEKTLEPFKIEIPGTGGRKILVENGPFGNIDVNGTKYMKFKFLVSGSILYINSETGEASFP
ncbi:hypothetical protein HZA39_00385 [Candidatus Peregrinibacteria bacterium]|nr:hypothetical protein [Candidatus Peregrinibacteria bacterium]